MATIATVLAIFGAAIVISGHLLGVPDRHIATLFNIVDDLFIIIAGLTTIGAVNLIIVLATAVATDVADHSLCCI